MIIPIVLISVGLIYFAQALGFISDEVTTIMWPLVLVVIGLGLMSNRYFGACCEDGTCTACHINGTAKKPRKKRSRK